MAKQRGFTGAVGDVRLSLASATTRLSLFLSVSLRLCLFSATAAFAALAPFYRQTDLHGCLFRITAIDTFGPVLLFGISAVTASSRSGT